MLVTSKIHMIYIGHATRLPMRCPHCHWEGHDLDQHYNRSLCGIKQPGEEAPRQLEPAAESDPFHSFNKQFAALCTSSTSSSGLDAHPQQAVWVPMHTPHNGPQTGLNQQPKLSETCLKLA